jgi:hypothetical protein
LATVFTLLPRSGFNSAFEACDGCIVARIAGVVLAKQLSFCPESLLGFVAQI